MRHPISVLSVSGIYIIHQIDVLLDFGMGWCSMTDGQLPTMLIWYRPTADPYPFPVATKYVDCDSKWAFTCICTMLDTTRVVDRMYPK